MRREEWIASSVEEFVEKAVRLSSNPDRLQQMREQQRELLERSPLRDPDGLARALEQAYRSMWQRFCDNSELQDKTESQDKSLVRQQKSLIKPRKLHIGGKVKTPGWEVLNAVPGPYVDHLGNAKDLSQFADNTFTDIYASHVVEHLDYVNELVATLKEWNRVLVPGGKIYISVPDMEVLAELFLAKDKLTLEERLHVMRMMFGGHVDQYDYHLVGLNYDFLTMYLKRAGFINIQRVEKFGFFQDTSNMQFKGVPISVNVVAEKLM